MNDNVRKVFDILGVEPNEEFKIIGFEETKFYIDERLYSYFLSCGNWVPINNMIRDLLNGNSTIIKLPKKKKLRYVTSEEYYKWKDKYCRLKIKCKDCCFDCVVCAHSSNRCWVKHKELYSDYFLDQEIEVE